MKFVKMHACGNDYVYFFGTVAEGLPPEFLTFMNEPSWPAHVRAISDRHTGVGSDGVIVICTPTRQGAGQGAIARMRMFNADGSEAQMCGNGVRCVAKLLHDRQGLHHEPLRVETGRGVLAIEYETEASPKTGLPVLTRARVNMGSPILAAHEVPAIAQSAEAKLLSIPIEKLLTPPQSLGLDPTFSCVSMGNPHVIFWGKVKLPLKNDHPIHTLGPIIEHHAMFPQRTNVHIACVITRNHLRIVSHERGAGITQACGTGACACVVAGVLNGTLDRQVNVQVPGGELDIGWDEPSGCVFMTGEAVEVFEGEWPGL